MFGSWRVRQDCGQQLLELAASLEVDKALLQTVDTLHLSIGKLEDVSGSHDYAGDGLESKLNEQAVPLALDIFLRKDEQACLVLKVDCPALILRQASCGVVKPVLPAGVEYQPHITLAVGSVEQLSKARAQLAKDVQHMPSIVLDRESWALYVDNAR